jgi:hypothetical protein
MSYNNGPMISERHFDEFLAPYYQKLLPCLRELNIVPIVDTDGDVTKLVPWLLREGIQGVLPLERQAGVEGLAIRRQYPEIAMVGSAWSFLRHFAPNVGASIIRNGQASFMGFGRNSFAYPSMPLDLMKHGIADPRKTCITCSGCTRLIRSFRPGGCVIHDREIYGNELKNLIADEK